MNKEQISKELSKIQSKVIKKYPDLFKTKKVNEDILKVLDIASKKKKFPEWKRKYYKAMKSEFKKEKIEVDPELAKKREKYLEKLIKQAKKEGRLPEEPPKLK